MDRNKPVIDLAPFQEKKDMENKRIQAYGNWDFIWVGKEGEKKIKANSIVNIEVVLENDENIKGKLAYNEFTYDVEVLEKIPLMYSTIDKGLAKNDLESAMLGYMEKQYHVLFSKNNFNDALKNVSNRHKFNPVTDYLTTCYNEWDEVERIPEFFPSFLGVEYGEVTTLITQLWLVGAVAKVFRPETKFDFVLDLVGGQGTGKTTTLRKLANGWYTDAITDFKDKDNLSLMIGSWIVNDDEMVATQASKFEEIKKFVTATEVEFRKPYDRITERYLKNFVIARTTNHIEYLMDKTGERRFLPLLANADRQLFHPVDDLDQEYINQLWGEAVHLWQGGFKFSLTKEQTEMLEEHRKTFQHVDDIESAIETYLSIEIPENFDKWEKYKRKNYIQDMMDTGYSKEGVPSVDRNRVASSDVAWECFGKDIASDRKLANKIKYIFDNSKEWKASRFRVNGIYARGYVRNVK